MTKVAREALYDSEAALRLVDSALQDMTGDASLVSSDAGEHDSAEPHDAGSAASIVATGYRELGRLRTLLAQGREALADSSREPHLDEAPERLEYASAVLTETEARVTCLMRLLLPAVAELSGPLPRAIDALAAGDPAATGSDAPPQAPVAGEAVGARSATRG